MSFFRKSIKRWLLRKVETEVRNRRFPSLTLAIMMALFCLIALPDGIVQAKIKEGDEVLNFNGIDFLTNQPVNLAEHSKRKVILLDFGSIYCSSCMVTVPNLIKLSKEYPAEKLAIFNIYLDIYNPQRVVKFFSGFARDLKFSLLIDNKLQISRDYGVDTLPTTVIIDKNGIVRRVITGYTEADEKEISKIIDDLIREMPSTVMPAAGKVEENLVIFTPESFTKTFNDSVFIVGYVSAPGAKDVSLKLNNLSERITKTKDNMFHFQTKLALAMNLVELKSQVEDGKFKTESVVIFREPLLGMEIKSELPLFQFHIDEEKKVCVKCHKLTLTPQEKESQQSTQVCLTCHKDLTNQIFVHGPIPVGGCLPCHDYTSFPVKYELRTTGPNLCFTCHEAMRDRMKKINQHGPVAAGVCVVCHDPHGSPERYLLRRKLDQQCISCHQDTLQVYAKTSVHTPVKEGNCAGCHDPHASDYKWFLKKDIKDVCGICHEEGSFQHTHKTISPPTKEIVPGEGAPLLIGGVTTCMTCHLAHAGDFEKVVRGTKDGYCGKLCH